MVVAQGSAIYGFCDPEQVVCPLPPLCLCGHFTEPMGSGVDTAGDGCHAGGDEQSKSSLGTKFGGGQEQAGVCGLGVIPR